MGTRWVVQKGDPRTLGALLAKSVADARAIADGRVFVGRKRALSPSESVAPGDIVTVADEVAQQPVAILLREGDLVAVNKPAGIPTIADHGGSSHCLAASVARELDLPEERVHATSRLDRDVSGVVIFALSKSVATRLLEAREQHRYVRRYLAIARSGAAETPAPPFIGTWNAPIGRANDPRHRMVNGRSPIDAVTQFSGCARTQLGLLLAVAPLTGRTHQIRVHAAHAGLPLFGDSVYGGPTRVTLPSGRVLGLKRIALHAARVEVPGEREQLTISAPVPDELRSLWQELGGEPTAWDMALSCELPSR